MAQGWKGENTPRRGGRFYGMSREPPHEGRRGLMTGWQWNSASGNVLSGGGRVPIIQG